MDEHGLNSASENKMVMYSIANLNGIFKRIKKLNSKISLLGPVFTGIFIFIFRQFRDTPNKQGSKSANHIPVFISCHFYGNEPQVQVILVGCDWWISILVC